MKQKFIKLEDGKIKWKYENEPEDIVDTKFGKVTKASEGYMIFNSFEEALFVLDNDIEETEKTMAVHKEEMNKNVYDEEKFNQIKPLVDSVGKLHNDFKECMEMPKTVSAANMGKYHVLVKRFNEAKDYIINELSEINKIYGKFLKHGPAKQAYEFNVDQLEKINKQKEDLMKLQ